MVTVFENHSTKSLTLQVYNLTNLEKLVILEKKCELGIKSDFRKNVIFEIFWSRKKLEIKCFLNELLTMGWVLSLNFSRSPWSKNSSATRLAKRCCCSQGLAIALTSQAVISMPHSTAKEKHETPKLISNFLTTLCSARVSLSLSPVAGELF